MDFAFDIRAQEIDDGNLKTPNLTEYNTIFTDSTDDVDYGYCIRLTPDIWKFVIGWDYAGNDYALDDSKNVNIGESYLDVVLEQFNKKRFKEVYKYFWPTSGKCDIKLEMLFIRTKQ